MATRGQKAKVGIFLLINASALTALLLYIGGYGRGESIPYWIEFSESVLGLGEGSVVEFKGVPIGKVAATRVTDEGLPHVDIRIDPRKAELHEGVKAKLVIYSLATGMMAVSLEGGDRAAPPLRPGSQIPASPSVVQNFVSQVQDVLDDIRATIAQIRKGVEGMEEGELTETVRNFNGFVDDSRKFVAAADSALQGIAEKAQPGIDDFREAMKSARTVAADADKLLATLNAKVEPLQLDETVKAIGDTARNANELVAKLSITSEALTKAAGSFGANVDSAEYNFRETLKALDATLQSIRELAEYLKQDPASLLRGRGEPSGGK